MRSPLLVVGSLGLDSLKTPTGEVEATLGGTAAYFAMAASLYTDVWLVAAVGTDFPPAYRRALEERTVDLTGLQVLDGETFRWSGEYGADLNVAHTLEIHLNVFSEFHPTLPTAYRQAGLVFLANIQPALQLEVLQQVEKPSLVAVDSRDLWIQMSRDELTEVIRKSDLVFLNDAEIREYTREANLVAAARSVLALGPRLVVIKKGEHGAILVSQEDGMFAIPAFPHELVADPTGAGDSFAGAMLGYLARRGGTDIGALRRAVVHGSAVASFTVQALGTERLAALTMDEVLQRCRAFRYLTQFDDDVEGVWEKGT
ncbi:MAG: sugar kinase [Chloroflexi bacterium]|nr:sugar kinase [Chloroflexota bacterium]